MTHQTSNEEHLTPNALLSRICTLEEIVAVQTKKIDSLLPNTTPPETWFDKAIELRKSGMKYTDIAARLDKNPTTVKVRFQRWRAKVKKHMDDA